jgi:hypothetical protein
MPKPVPEHEDVTVLWNHVVHTGTEVTANKPDIIIKTEKTKRTDRRVIPADRYVMQKEMEKKLKYKSLCTEIQRMWNMKCMIIPVITGATGILTKG